MGIYVSLKMHDLVKGEGGWICNAWSNVIFSSANFICLKIVNGFGDMK